MTVSHGYADAEFYYDEYLCGRSPKIPVEEFDYWSMLASTEIKTVTFDRSDFSPEFQYEIGLCCCELAEKLYFVESVKGENGLILQSYGNDGETGTYKVDDLSDAKVQASIRQIIKKWLMRTGLMYRGVM